MFFDPPEADHNLRPLHDARNRRRVGLIVSAFHETYPTIRYDVFWDSRTVNAQAFVWEGRRCVRLYGGLARHRALTSAGLAWVLLHETGHHLGGPPFHDMQPQLSSEERADMWAAERGMTNIFGARRGARYEIAGRREISTFFIDRAPLV